MPTHSPQSALSRRTPVVHRCPRVAVPDATVAARVHARRQRERPLEGVLQHRDEEAAEPADPTARTTAQRLRRAHPASTVGQLREHRDGDDERRADLVERGGTDLSSRFGLASELAAPMQITIAASRSPS